MQGKRQTNSVEQLLQAIEARFGIKRDIFKDFFIYERKKGEFWITTREAFEFKFNSPVRYGFKFAQIFDKGFRLSTAAIQTFGHSATINVVELEKEEMEDFIRGKDLKNRWNIHKGQVIVKYKGFPLGSAVANKETLKNQVPVARRIKARLS